GNPLRRGEAPEARRGNPSGSSMPLRVARLATVLALAEHVTLERTRFGLVEVVDALSGEQAVGVGVLQVALQCRHGQAPDLEATLGASDDPLLIGIEGHDTYPSRVPAEDDRPARAIGVPYPRRLIVRPGDDQPAL